MVKETSQQAASETIDYVLFYVNGKKVVEHHAEPDWTLLWYLRNSKNFFIISSLNFLYLFN